MIEGILCELVPEVKTIEARGLRRRTGRTLVIERMTKKAMMPIVKIRLPEEQIEHQVIF